jgi:hypothetical protein
MPPKKLAMRYIDAHQAGYRELVTECWPDADAVLREMVNVLQEVPELMEAALRAAGREACPVARVTIELVHPTLQRIARLSRATPHERLVVLERVLRHTAFEGYREEYLFPGLSWMDVCVAEDGRAVFDYIVHHDGANPFLGDYELPDAFTKTPRDVITLPPMP